MTAEEALLLALQQNPRDEAARQAYADWLDENERRDEAGQIRSRVDLQPLAGTAVIFDLAARIEQLRKEGRIQTAE